MAKKKFILFKDDIENFCRKGWEYKIIGTRANMILVEAEVPDEPKGLTPYQAEDAINEPGEC